MDFKLRTTKVFYEEADRNLEKYGFTFVLGGNKYVPDEYYIDHSNAQLEINTLEELLEFVNEFGELIIISDGEIEIYNDYRE